MRMPRRCRLPSTSSTCSTASSAPNSCASLATARRCARSLPTARTGFLGTCAGSPRGQPMCGLWRKASLVDRHSDAGCRLPVLLVSDFLDLAVALVVQALHLAAVSVLELQPLLVFEDRRHP